MAAEQEQKKKENKKKETIEPTSAAAATDKSETSLGWKPIDATPNPYESGRPITLMLLGKTETTDGIIGAYAEDSYISTQTMAMKRFKITEPV